MKVALVDNTGIEAEGIALGTVGQMEGRLLHDPDFLWVLFDGQVNPVVVHESQVAAW